MGIIYAKLLESEMFLVRSWMLPGLLCHTEGDQSSLACSHHMHRHPVSSCSGSWRVLALVTGHAAGSSAMGRPLNEDVIEGAGGRETGAAPSCSRFPVRKG